MVVYLTKFFSGRNHGSQMFGNFWFRCSSGSTTSFAGHPAVHDSDFIVFPRGFFLRPDVVVLEQPWSGTTTVKLTSCDIIPRVNIKLFETEVKQLITQQTFHKSSVSPLNYITTPIKKWKNKSCLRRLNMPSPYTNDPMLYFLCEKDRPLTPHETNMTLPLNIGRNPGNNIVFQSSIFRCYVC